MAWSSGIKFIMIAIIYADTWRLVNKYRNIFPKSKWTMNQILYSTKIIILSCRSAFEIRIKSNEPQFQMSVFPMELGYIAGLHHFFPAPWVRPSPQHSLIHRKQLRSVSFLGISWDICTQGDMRANISRYIQKWNQPYYTINFEVVDHAEHCISLKSHYCIYF